MSKRSSPLTNEGDRKQELALRCRRFLKAELARTEVKYPELAERLNRMGIDESVKSITMKISRGVFPSWFLVAVLVAIGRENVRISDIMNGG